MFCRALVVRSSCDCKSRMTTVDKAHFEHSSRSKVSNWGDWTRGKVESSLPLAVIKSTAWWKKC